MNERLKTIRLFRLNFLTFRLFHFTKLLGKNIVLKIKLLENFSNGKQTEIQEESATNRHEALKRPIAGEPSNKEGSARNRWQASIKQIQQQQAFIRLAKNRVDYRRKYVSKLFHPSKYFMPKMISGLVKREPTGELVCRKNETIQTILRYVEKKLKQKNTEKFIEFQRLVLPPEGCVLSFVLDRDVTAAHAFLFDQGTTIPFQQIENFLNSVNGTPTPAPTPESQAKGDKNAANNDDDDDDGDEGDAHLSTYALLQAIQMGEKAFAPNARLDLSRLPNKEVKANESLLKKAKRAINRMKGILDKLIKWAQTQRSVDEQKERDEEPTIKEELDEEIQMKLEQLDDEHRQRLIRDAEEGKKIIESADIKFAGEPSDAERENEELRGAQALEESVYEFRRKIIESGDRDAGGSTNLKVFRRMLTPDQVANWKIHPFKFLQGVRYKIDVRPNVRNFKAINSEKFARWIRYKSNKNAQEFEKMTQSRQVSMEKRAKELDEIAENLGQEHYRSCLRCYELKSMLEEAIFDPDTNDLIAGQLRGRLGAQILNAVSNAKRYTAEIGMGLAASLLVSGGIAYGLDAQVWPRLIELIVKWKGERNWFTMLMSTIMNSSTAQAAETVDSVVIKRLLNFFNGGRLWFKNWDEFKENFFDSAKSGFIASLGQMPNNFLMLYKKWALIAPSAVANQVLFLSFIRSILR